MKISNFKDPNSEENKLAQDIFLSGVLIAYKLKFISNLSQNFGLCLNNINRTKYSNQISSCPIFNRREKIWDYAIKTIGNDKFIGLEFGVAWGYSSNYWTSRCKNLTEWHGFDTFAGLPERWRHYKRGHFSNQGIPPNLAIPELSWHIGLVEDTLDVESLIRPNRVERVAILLDLDLFLPTYYVVAELAPHLKEGDIIYFDEPHDNDEGAVLHVFMRLNEGKFKISAISPCQILLEITSDNLRMPKLN